MLNHQAYTYSPALAAGLHTLAVIPYKFSHSEVDTFAFAIKFISAMG